MLPANLQTIFNTGSGACLFKSISQLLFDGNEDNHDSIRQATVDYMVRVFYCIWQICDLFGSYKVMGKNIFQKISNF